MRSAHRVPRCRGSGAAVVQGLGIDRAARRQPHASPSQASLGKRRSIHAIFSRSSEVAVEVALFDEEHLLVSQDGGRCFRDFFSLVLLQTDIDWL